MLRKTFLLIGVVLLALALSFVALVEVYRLRGPTEQQRAALALLHKDYRPTQGVNALPLLWFLRYDVTADQRDARLAVEVVAVRQRLDTSEPVVSHTPDVPLLPGLPFDESVLCDALASSCLAQVVAHTDAVRAVVDAHPELRDRAKAFEKTDYYWNEFPPDWRLVASEEFARDIPSLWLSTFALRYVDGDRLGALAATCRNLGAWRRMRHGTNSLIAALVASNRADGAIRLYADMLAGLQAGENIPADCMVALQPVAAVDVDRCAQQAREFASAENVMSGTMKAVAAKSLASRAASWLQYDERQSAAWRAEDLADSCGDAAVGRMLADEHASDGLRRPVMRRFECVASLAGCVLADIAAPTYADYDDRALDFAAHLRLAATLLWLREHPESELSARFEQRPANLRSARHVSGVDTARGTIYVDNLYATRDARFELPVARTTASLATAPASASP